MYRYCIILHGTVRSSHVSNCCFTSENSADEPGEEYLVTVGGNDDTVIVWKHTMATF